MSNLFKHLILSIIIIYYLSACSASKTKIVKKDTQFAKSGAIYLTKKMPNKNSVLSLDNAIGFMPILDKVVEKDPTINTVIDLTQNKIIIQNNLSEKENFKIESNLNISNPVSNKKVLLKQANPLWYASDNYFINRGLPIPAKGSSQRYLKGVLGSKVIYIENNIAIYNGPFTLQEINGIRVNEKAMKRLFQILNNQSSVLIKK